jgi:hypothetical protein
MTEIGEDSLQNKLEKHSKWLENKPGGERFVLCSANLSKANLREANLRKADLREADLYRADLYEADLREANLYGADLRGADLRGADLRGTNLIGANGIEYIVVSSPIGSRQDTLIWNMKDDIAKTGCFTGTLADLEAVVGEKHANNPLIRDEYRLWIAHFRAVKAIRFPEGLHHD